MARSISGPESPSYTPVGISGRKSNQHIDLINTFTKHCGTDQRNNMTDTKAIGSIINTQILLSISQNQYIGTFY